MADLVKIKPTKSYLNLENNGTSDIVVSKISTENARPGQVIVLDRLNRIENSDTTTGLIYIGSQINPDANNDQVGNIRIPSNLLGTDVASQGYDELELKYNRIFNSTIASGDLYQVIKTVVTLMFDGAMWNVISVVENSHWETQ